MLPVAIAAKLRRAWILYQEFSKDLDSWLSRGATFRIEKGFLRSDRKYSFFAHPVRELPPEIAILAGEIVHHCRTCLDHLVVDLALRRGQQPTREHQFPLCDTQQKFDQVMQKKLKGLDDAQVAIIRSVQPFCQAAPEESVFTIIQNLDNRNKHRLLILSSITVFIGGSLVVECSSGPVSISGLSAPRMITPAPQGAEVFFIDLLEPDPLFSASAEFKNQISLHVDEEGRFCEVKSFLEQVIAMCHGFVKQFYAS